MMTSPRPLIEADGIEAVYRRPRGRHAVTALRGVDIVVEAGEMTAVIGRSGAGKTTLLRCLNGFVRPSAGRLVVDGVDVSRVRGRDLRRFRRRVATIYQHFNLVERTSALDNALCGRLGHVGLWRSLVGWFPREDCQLAHAALAELGLASRALERVDRLSGGERQRVAIARALVQQPTIVLADEPASSLDASLARSVLDALLRLNREHGLTVLVNLHDLGLATAYARRIIALSGGRVVFDGPPHRLSADARERIYDGTDAAPDLATDRERLPRLSAAVAGQ